VSETSLIFAATWLKDLLLSYSKIMNHVAPIVQIIRRSLVKAERSLPNSVRRDHRIFMSIQLTRT